MQNAMSGAFLAGFQVCDRHWWWLQSWEAWTGAGFGPAEWWLKAEGFHGGNAVPCQSGGCDSCRNSCTGAACGQDMHPLIRASQRQISCKRAGQGNSFSS